MNEVLRPYLRKLVVVFLDDIVIFSKTREEHLTHVRTYGPKSEACPAMACISLVLIGLHVSGQHAEEEKEPHSELQWISSVLRKTLNSCWS